MHTDFQMPEGVIGRFAIVKLWPEIKAAEDECIARLKIAASALGVECVEVHADGTFLTDPSVRASKETVDFVIHLHFDTPKAYDAFSFVALWNPLKFYHEWGYHRCSRNLTTHDDFLSCSSNAADDHVRRMIRHGSSHLPPHFNLYHSTANIAHAPSLGDGKLAYAGINWDALKGGKSRHQEVLRLLDGTGLLRIYGPHIFMDVKVWAGYESYVREVPFDGVSMVDEISKAGISLVLSSQAHKEAELMSNRLFESIAAGALIICDENPFAKRFFGNSLLYIDSRSSPAQIVDDIKNHLNWAHDNVDEALAKIEKSQEIFREKFSLTRNLSQIYQNLEARKRDLRLAQTSGASQTPRIELNLLMPEYSESVLKTHLESIQVQEYENFSATLVVDAVTVRDNRDEIENRLAECGANVRLVEVNYFDHGLHEGIRSRRRLGAVINELVFASRETDAFMVVAPNERLFSNHLTVLSAALQRNPGVNCAATAALLAGIEKPIHSVHEVIDFGHVNPDGPPGYGRFIFRTSAIPADIDIALPYLDGRPLAVLVGDNLIDQQMPATIVIDLKKQFPERQWDDAAENEIIRSYSPDALRLAVGFAASAIERQPALSAGNLVRTVFTRQWIDAQWRALRKHGFASRFQAMRRRLRS
jgi:hypothetical protein